MNKYYIFVIKILIFLECGVNDILRKLKFIIKKEFSFILIIES